MKGSTPNASQKAFHDALCSIVGCVACRIDGSFTDFVSVHHCDGRTKPHAHHFVLPLCSGHHQDGTGVPGLLAIHPWKRRFEQRYGTQRELLARCVDVLIEAGHPIPQPVQELIQ